MSLLLMVSFDLFSIKEGSPIYMQILRFVKRGIISGSISDGDELPSRRVLSSLIGINPNTVQKAYRMLEEEGLIQSHSGTKSCMVISSSTMKRIREELMKTDILSVISDLKQGGISKAEALGLIEKYWDRKVGAE